MFILQISGSLTVGWGPVEGHSYYKVAKYPSCWMRFSTSFTYAFPRLTTMAAMPPHVLYQLGFLYNWFVTAWPHLLGRLNLLWRPIQGQLQLEAPRCIPAQWGRLVYSQGKTLGSELPALFTFATVENACTLRSHCSASSFVVDPSVGFLGPSYVSASPGKPRATRPEALPGCNDSLLTTSGSQ